MEVEFALIIVNRGKNVPNSSRARHSFFLLFYYLLSRFSGIGEIAANIIPLRLRLLVASPLDL
jgi:hypothetical protein